MRAPLRRPAMVTRGVTAARASRTEPQSDSLLRGERPSTVRSTETDATAKPFAVSSARGAGTECRAAMRER